MDDVWKEITLSSTSFPNNHHHRNNVVVFQDFLSTTATLPQGGGGGGGGGNRGMGIVSFQSPASAAGVVQLPVTALSLNSGMRQDDGFRFLDHHHHHNHRHRVVVGVDDVVGETGNHQLRDVGQVMDYNVGFDAFSPYPFMASFGKKRFSEEAEMGSGDRRHKRMIKNRESAARSRARKQAYVSELQQEIAQLREENARLWRQQQQQQQQQLPAQAPPVAILQVPNKLQKPPRLQRTSTAPF